MHKSKCAGRKTMGKGLHELAYSLTLDPAEEIRGAVSDVSTKSWNELQSLDTLVAESMPDGIEAEVMDAPVYARGSEASYRSEAVELPMNYRDSGYKAADDDDADAQVTYTQQDSSVQAQKTFQREIEEKMHFDMLQLQHEAHYASVEQRERVDIRKIEMGYAMRFLLTAITQACF